MKKQTFKEICDLSFIALGHKYAWKKLRSKGIVSERTRVNPAGPNLPAFRARRMPISVEGVKHYLKTTIELQQKIKQDMEAKANEQGRD